MGTLTYDSVTKVDFDDRVLAHMRVVIGTKLRRGESFFLTWKDDQSVGYGQTTVWLNAAIPLGFKLSGTRDIAINPLWIEELMVLANSAGGLRPSNEPARSSPAAPVHS